MISHARIEKNSILLVVLILIVVAIGGLIEIVPNFYLGSTIEKVSGVRPYTPLELAGRNIYIREGCYLCHSQMIRPFRDELERYGHFSLAAESMFDHPFQWGSKRTGPDLARVGGRYSDDWHFAHLVDPRSIVPESVMPTYGFLAEAPLDTSQLANDLKANRTVGVPYTDDMIASTLADVKAQASADDPGVPALVQRYPGALAHAFGADNGTVTEMDALIAYLQVLGRMVDFSTYKADENLR
jgi:cytochrome c oxidase cbb3-type subunit II